MLAGARYATAGHVKVGMRGANSIGKYMSEWKAGQQRDLRQTCRNRKDFSYVSVGRWVKADGLPKHAMQQYSRVDPGRRAASGSQP